MVATLIAAGAQYLATATGMSIAYATFAVNFAVSLIVTRIFADNPETQQDMGVRQQVPPSAVNAIPIVYGDAYMGGTFVDAVLTTDQKTMYYVLAISSISEANATLGTAAGVFNYDTTKMFYGDRLITFDGSDLTKVISLTDEAGNVDTKISGNLYISLYKSSSAGVITSANGASAPSTVMGGSDIAVGQRWPAANRQMNNLGFAIVKLVYNRDADTTQLQPITFSVSHYPNGASVAKPGDVWLDYVTNKSYGGAIGWLPDGSFTASNVDTASATALNVYSDATITFTPAGGGSPVTQARYRINGVLDAGQTVLSNLDRIMSACDSWMTYNAALGQWSVVMNKAESTAYAFTDNNIIGDIRVSATDITSSINQVEARFPFKSNRDQASFVNIQTPVGLLYPNEPVNKYSITYDLVNDSVQAQYLANRLLEQAREDLLVSFNTSYYGIQVDAGNVISVTNADYGWNAKLFRVMKVNEASLPDGSLGARLEIVEYNAQVYDDFDITQFTAAPNSDLASPVFFSALSAPTVTASRPTDAVPSFDIQISIPATGRVTFGTLFYTINPSDPLAWKVLDSASSPNNTPVANSTNYTFANQVLPAGTFYFTYTVGNEIASSQRSANSAAFVWSPTGSTGPAGSNGLTALTAYRVQNQSSATPTFTTPTSGATAPSGWSLSAPAVAVGQVMWYIQGRYNSNAVTIDGVAAGTTAWTGPVAASVFQDIRSDNWNGSNPPVYGSSGTYGTTGYYIQQSTGDVFFNNGIFRGNIIGASNIEITGSAKFNGAVTTSAGTSAITANVTFGQRYGLIAYADNSPYSPVVQTAAVYGVGSGMAFGVRGESYGAGGVGVVGFGDQHGVEGNSSATGGVGVRGYGYASNGTGVSGIAYVTGPGVYGNSLGGGPAVWCDGIFKWSTYSIAVPTGSSSDVLRGNGTWGAVSFATNATNATYADYLGGVIASSWARIFPTNLGVANAGGSGLNILGSGSTGIVGAYVVTSGTSNIVTIEVTTTSPSDIRLKDEISNIDLGLAFVNKLRPVSYKLIADPKRQKGYGFIADEVDQIIESGSSLVYYEPDWKVGDEKGFKTIHYPSYIAVLTKAIQELSAQVEELKKQIPKI
jgi:hypothetical protein